MINLIFFILKIAFLRLEYPSIKIGEKSKIDWKTKIDIKNNRLTIGENVYLRSKKKGYHAGMPFATTILLDRENAFCNIGDNCRINGAFIHAQKGIVIGENTVIAAGAQIIDSNGHITKSLNRTIGRDTPQMITIGKNVWIGLNCIILKGSKIGDNSIIAAGSVVKGEFQKDSIIQGNPAKCVSKIKFDNENNKELN